MANEPLFLPRGSIRALLALMMTGTFFYLDYNKGWDISQVPESLTSLMLVIVAFYFGARSMEAGSDSSSEKKTENRGLIQWITSLKDSPLFLPKGTIRFIMIVMFGVISYFSFSHHSSVPDALLQILTIIAGYLLGIVITYIYHKISDQAASKVSLFGHVKAIITILFVGVVDIAHIFSWSFATAEITDRLMTLLITFYFGSRTLVKA